MSMPAVVEHRGAQREITRNDPARDRSSSVLKGPVNRVETGGLGEVPCRDLFDCLARRRRADGVKAALAVTAGQDPALRKSRNA